MITTKGRYSLDQQIDAVRAYLLDDSSLRKIMTEYDIQKEETISNWSRNKKILQAISKLEDISVQELYERRNNKVKPHMIRYDENTKVSAVVDFLYGNDNLEKIADKYGIRKPSRILMWTNNDNILGLVAKATKISLGELKEVKETKISNSFDKMSDEELLEYGRKRGYSSFHFKDLKNRNRNFYIALSRRNLLGEFLNKTSTPPTDLKLNAIKEYLSTSLKSREIGNKYKVSGNAVVQWLYSKNIFENLFPQVFNLDYLVAEGFKQEKAERLINNLVKQNKLYKIKNNYTFDKELADAYKKLGKTLKLTRSRSVTPTKLRDLSTVHEIELVKSKNKISRRSISYKADTTKNGSEKITNKLIAVLKAANIQPDNAFGYVSKLKTQNSSLENYIDIYEKELFPLSYNLLKKIIKVDNKEKVLDLGNGVNAAVLTVIKSQHKNVDYIGLDIVEEIQHKNQEMYPDGNFLVANVPYELEKIQNKFDLITSSLFFDTLNIPEIYATLFGAHQLLKDDGKILITLSQAREKEASVILNILKSMNYKVESNPSAYRHTLKMKTEDGLFTNRFYIIEAEKTNLNLEQLRDHYLAVSYLHAGKLKEAKQLSERSKLSHSLRGLAWEDIQLTKNSHQKPTFFIYDSNKIEKIENSLNRINQEYQKMERELNETKMKLDSYFEIRTKLNAVNVSKKVKDLIITRLSVLGIDATIKMLGALKNSNLSNYEILNRFGIGENEISSITGKSISQKRKRIVRSLMGLAKEI